MAHIQTGNNLPGIMELLFYKGPTGEALSKLAHTLLHGPSGLTPGERELIAAYVSKLNDCEFCYESHSASANVHLNDEGRTTNCVLKDPAEALISDKLKALLRIASRVQKSGREVHPEVIELARQQGASDEDIHDTVLIAAAFCMYNRYVDGLGARVPAEKADYLPMGERMAKTGYKYPPKILRKLLLWFMQKKFSK